MADVRGLLRAERANRRITHPYASYMSEGKLLCNLCEIILKSEAHWQSHLHSTQHNLRSQRAQDAKDVRGAGKKRKAEDMEQEDSEAEGRKKTKPASPGAEVPREQNEDLAATDVTEDEPPTTEQVVRTSTTASLDSSLQTADDDYAAFERDLAALQQDLDQSSRSALNAEATISAAPVTAEELAAQAREEQSEQRGKRNAEIEGEREDAARLLQEEYEEMEGLDERVRRLRERREALRNVASLAEADSKPRDEEVNGEVATKDDDDDGDNDDDYDDGWGFGGS